MNPEREKFLRIIKELSRKYDVETEEITGNFVMVGRKRQGNSGTQRVESKSSKKSAASGETGP